MGQQYPYLPNGQQANPYGQAWYPQGGGFPAGYGQPAFTPGQAMPGQPFPQGMQGIDPAMLAQAQQAMANPDEGDGFEGLLPSPKNAALGAVTGAGLALFFNELEKRKSVDEAVQHLHRIPGLKWLDDKFSEQLTKIQAKEGYWSKRGWVQDSVKEMFYTDSVGLVKIGAGDDAIKAAAKKSVDEMQKRQIEETLKVFEKYASSDTRELQAKLAKKFENETTFEKLLTAIKTELAEGDVTKQNKKVRKSLHRLKQRISGLNDMYLPVYKGQVERSAALQAKGVGPIGRLLANGVNYLKRTFSGETMSMGMMDGGSGGNIFQKAGQALSPWLGPLVGGALLMGSSFQKASKAQDGEKHSTFFHDFFGTVIANTMGWEFGRKLLNSFQFGNKLLGKRALNLITPRFLPVIGGITLGGFVTEIVALFVIGSLFQRVGEGLSHLIFGKPSEESLEGKGKKKSTQTQQPPQPGINPSMQRGMGPDDAARREQIKKMLVLPKRPTTTLTPEMISRNVMAEKQRTYEQAFINSPWDAENTIDPFGRR